MVINSTCVSLSWTLLDNSSVPLFMVVQWSPLRPQGQTTSQSGDTWARLAYTDRPTYLRGDMPSVCLYCKQWKRLKEKEWYDSNTVSGDFFGSEECGFYLYPVFADGEGDPAYATGRHWHEAVSVSYETSLTWCFLTVAATRGDAALYMMLMIISFLSIVLFVTLVLSQNQ